jgi:hypothetical protein
VGNRANVFEDGELEPARTGLEKFTERVLLYRV